MVLFEWGGAYGKGWCLWYGVLVFWSGACVLWRGTCRTGLLVVVICCNP